MTISKQKITLILITSLAALLTILLFLFKTDNTIFSTSKSSFSSESQNNSKVTQSIINNKQSNTNFLTLQKYPPIKSRILTNSAENQEVEIKIESQNEISIDTASITEIITDFNTTEIILRTTNLATLVETQNSVEIPPLDSATNTSITIARNSTCKAFPNQFRFAHRGGNISIHQENTLEIFLDSAIKGISIEMDLMLLATGEIVVYHDANTVYKTGTDMEIMLSSWEKVSELTYLQNFNERNYSTSPKIPLLKNALEIICSTNNQTHIWLDIKYAFGEKYILALLDALEASPCACDARQNLVVEIFQDYSALEKLRKLMEKRRCKVLTAMSFYDFQTGNGEAYLRSSIDFYSKYSDIIDFPTSMVKKFPWVLELNEAQSVCSAVYGHDKQEMIEVFENELVDIAIFPIYD
jgi:glycerophosphoryl diester phosphodiesterase